MPADASEDRRSPGVAVGLPGGMLPHASNTAASHAVTGIPTASPDERTGTVRGRLAGQRFDSLDGVYLVDRDGRLQGKVRLERLFAAPDGDRLADLAERVPTVLAGEDQERVATQAVGAGVAEVPVVSQEGRLLGVVPAATLVAILRAEHIEDLHRFTGIRTHSDHAVRALNAAPLDRAGRRLPWLLVGFAGSAVASLVMSRFERELSARMAVAVFVPAIVYLADAIGTQSEAVAVRGLSFNHTSLARLVGGELVTGLAIGSALGALAFPAVWVGFGDPLLALTVALAILFAGAAATSIGILLPWVLSRLGFDPALGSGPVATVIQDILSLLVYLGLATALVF